MFVVLCCFFFFLYFFFFQAEDGIRDLVRSRGLGDVYKRQDQSCPATKPATYGTNGLLVAYLYDGGTNGLGRRTQADVCLLYTSDAADERSSVGLGGRRIIQKKKK